VNPTQANTIATIMSSEGGGGGGAAKRKNRGPRSQRNRKRARPEQVIEYNVSIRPLALNDIRIDPITYVRTIEPYPYTFSTFAKARWIAKSVLDVYCSEFGSYPPTYYRAAIQQGRIRVSDKQVHLDYKIKGNDVLSHTVHRHEPGVVVAGPESPIRIVAETADLLVVDKPSTLPVHPCGAYQQNTLLPILEPTFGKLHIIHRLDRLTSGLVLLAKNSTVAQTWGKALMERNTCTKVYVARVKGKFPTQCPSHLKRLDVPVQYGVFQNSIGTTTTTTTTESDPGSIDVLRAANALGCWITDAATGKVLPACAVTDIFSSHQSIDEWIDDPTQGTNPKSTAARWFHMACPTRIANHKDGICEAGSFQDLSDDVYLKSVKPAQTSFGVVRYDVDTDSTIVVCRPQTGRTHQIRLHLQYLGHPIANDPCYGGDIWYGNDKGKLECQEAASILEHLNSAAASSSGTNADATQRSSSSDEVATISDTPATEAEIEQLAQLVRDENEPLEEFYKKTCVWCARSAGTDRTMLELLVRSRGIWLHALKYRMMDSKSTELSYRTEVPSWS
jgi:23S rRNA-/tRNA-specific pseudouridylate synthase